VTYSFGDTAEATYDSIRTLPFYFAKLVGVVGSISADGAPQSALVGFAVTDELEIVFDTLSDTRKYRNFVAKS